MTIIDCARSDHQLAIDAMDDGVTLRVFEDGEVMQRIRLNTAETDLLAEACLEAVVEVAEG